MSAVEDRLAEIMALADAATDGPWMTEPGSWVEGGYVRDGRGYSLLDGSDASCEVGTERLADAVFIAHARTDVPELVAALRAVLDLAQHHYGFTVDHDSYGALGDIARAAIGSALGVSYDEL